MNTTDWARGYFCAVAQMIRIEGKTSTTTEELFKAGGDSVFADPEDRTIFREHGLIKE